MAYKFIKGTLPVQGPLSGSSTLEIVGAAYFGSTVAVTGSVTAGSFIIGSANINEAELEQIDGITAGTVAASKAVVVDSNKDITGFRNVTATGYFEIGSAQLTESELEMLDGITAGTVAASKAVVVDSDKDADGFRNIDGSGDLTMGTITMSGFVVDADGDVALKTLAVDDGSTIGCDSDADLLTLSANILQVKGSVSGSGTLHHNGAATFGSTLQTSGAMLVKGGLTSTAAANSLGASSFTSISASSWLEVVGKATVGGAFNLSGAALVQGGITSTAASNTFGATSFNDANITNVGSIALDSISADDGSSFSFGSNWTAASRTCADLGSVTTVDINGGTADNVVIGGATPAAGTFTALVAGGNVDLGDATSDTITATGRFDSDLVPSTDSARDLGSTALQWAEAHVDAGYIDAISGSSTLQMVGAAILGSTLNVSGAATFASSVTAGSSFIIGSADLNETDMEKLDGITNGTVAASKAIVVDASKDFSGYRNISGSGTIQAVGKAIFGGTMDLSGNLSINGSITGALANVSGSGEFACLNVDCEDVVSAGGGFSIDGTTVITSAQGFQGTTVSGSTNLTMGGTVRLDGVTDAAFNVAADKLYFLDADDRLMHTEASSDFLSAIAGSGLSVSSNQLIVSANNVSLKADGDSLVEGYNYCADSSSDIGVTMPASPTVGDMVCIKAGNLTSGAAITVSRAGSQTMDGETSLVISSPYGAISFVFVAANTWRIV